MSTLGGFGPTNRYGATDASFLSYNGPSSYGGPSDECLEDLHFGFVQFY